MPPFDSAILRILDASLNRSTEGLRVVDDYVRFVLDDGFLTSQLKQLRHDLAASAAQLNVGERHAARDMAGDVGAAISTASERSRVDTWSVCRASCERVKQSLRSLEEYSKVSSSDLGAQLEQLRYRFYDFEAALGRTLNSRERLANVRLCVLIDGGESEEAFAELVGQLIDAGVGMIQLRDKKLSDRELLRRTRTIVERIRLEQLKSDSDGPICFAIVNDRADIASAANAHGVHLGQDDLSITAARKIIGPSRLIGYSTHSLEQAEQAVLEGANYLGAGPTFPSQTKSFDEFPGLYYLSEVAESITLPTFAIGGITTENVEQVVERGMSRIAVSGAVARASEPGKVVEKLNRLLTRE
ncbi:thiamine phosphate synthase [Adhaeretor mobilis]|uniref:Thiamine-phosphate synthase n=1 Tax=Adhaeretor mobilis TaxID=1930276 RepID=A0A517N206_9BACT|nr:thiamine phosphate synthase [Adhaeretor mobilis]QDT01172.1 Thiamine-phosphate synthase [Adhaeretor mobilis]